MRNFISYIFIGGVALASAACAPAPGAFEQPTARADTPSPFLPPLVGDPAVHTVGSEQAKPLLDALNGVPFLARPNTDHFHIEKLTLEFVPPKTFLSFMMGQIAGGQSDDATGIGPADPSKQTWSQKLYRALRHCGAMQGAPAQLVVKNIDVTATSATVTDTSDGSKGPDQNATAKDLQVVALIDAAEKAGFRDTDRSLHINCSRAADGSITCKAELDGNFDGQSVKSASGAKALAMWNAIAAVAALNNIEPVGGGLEKATDLLTTNYSHDPATREVKLWLQPLIATPPPVFAPEPPATRVEHPRIPLRPGN
jgi:hypothetical protein